jgi:hypothetical protein
MPYVICGLGLYLLYKSFEVPNKHKLYLFFKICLKFKNQKNWKYSDDVFQTENQGKRGKTTL